MMSQKLNVVCPKGPVNVCVVQSAEAGRQWSI